MLDLPPCDLHNECEHQNSSYIQCLVKSIKNSSYSYFLSKPTIAGIIKIKPDKSKKYKDLQCTQEEREKIIDLFTTMGTHGKISLLVNHKSRLEQIGKDIENVYPLTLLEVIFTTPNMRKYMREVMSDYFKRTNFIDGISPSLTNESIKGKLQLFLPDFCAIIKVPHVELKKYADNRDWRGFIEFIIDYYPN